MGVARKLYSEGGVKRFYRGLVPTLIYTPLVRFGGIAATDGAFEALGCHGAPAAAAAAVAAAGAAGSRALLMPLSALSTSQQVAGRDGWRLLLARARKSPTSLWNGASSAMIATWLGHWVWCTADKQLRACVPHLDVSHGTHARNAIIGFASGLLADACTNPFRVLCTLRQTASEPGRGGCLASAHELLRKEGAASVLGRGLATRMLMNGMQGALLTVGWKAIASKMTN